MDAHDFGIVEEEIRGSFGAVYEAKVVEKGVDSSLLQGEVVGLGFWVAFAIAGGSSVVLMGAVVTVVVVVAMVGIAGGAAHAVLLKCVAW